MDLNSCNLIELDSQLDETAILRIIENRFSKNEIYTYAAKILIAVNPYQEIENLYGRNEIKSYNGKPIGELSPHVYAIANDAMESIRCSKNQSFIISGISGAGKTRTCSSLIDFLCETAESNDFIKQNILNSGPILEAFGNANTTENSNSSRFCKYIELYYNNYDTPTKLIGGRVSEHLLESNRVSCKVPGQSNFQIFYALLFGGPRTIMDQLFLSDPKQRFRILPDQENQAELISKHRKKFKIIDSTLTQFGLLEEQKIALYKVIALILHLGNIEFQDNAESCQILETGKSSLENTAILLGVDTQTLRESIMTRIINEKNGATSSKITIPLGSENATKAKETFSRLLFENLFRQVLSFVNDSISVETSSSSIGILDIAGFECLEINTFDQLCINYVNENFQQIFVERMLIDEKKWYDEDGLDVPFVPFFDNHEILELFDHTSRGIFATLNDVCRIDGTSINIFLKMLQEWKHPAISFSNGVGKKNSPSSNNGFIIRHFACDVQYQTNDFIEKNCWVLSPSLIPIIQGALQQITKKDSTIDEHKSIKTTASELKTDLKKLMNVIKKCETRFIRCIKPNSAGRVNVFDNEFALKQLRSSSIIPYVHLMRFGYPERLNIDQIYNSFKPKYELRKGVSSDRKQFCQNLLLSNGFDKTDFKFGMEFIFLRGKCSASLDKFINPDPRFIEESIQNLKKYSIRLEWKKLCRKALLVYGHKKQARTSKNEISDKSAADKLSETINFENKLSGKSKDGELSIPAEPIQFDRSKVPFKTSRRKGSAKKVSPTLKPPSKRSKNERKPLNSLRYDCMSHFADFDKNINATRCKNEECKSKTHIFCTKCNVHLCLTPSRNCFKHFHLLSINN